ncbi:hypothetical protein BH09ACT10_BH09ACT10_03880 [soil metagenome]
MYSNNGDMDGSWGSVMILGMVGLWVVAAVGFWLVIRSTRVVGPGGASVGAPSTTGSAERILAERLARGDIEESEYESRLRTLTS